MAATIWDLHHEVLVKPPAERTDSEATALAKSLATVKFCATLGQQLLEQLCKKFEHEFFEAGSNVFEKGDAADRFYIIISNSQLDVLVPDPVLGLPTTIATLSHGEGFGELGLLTSAPRAATVRCNEPTHLISLSKSNYSTELRSLHSERIVEDAKYLQDIIRCCGKPSNDRTEDDIETLVTAIITCPYFNDVDTETQFQLCKRMGYCCFPKGSIVFQKGTVGSQFYIVLLGSAEVVSEDTMGDLNKVIATLGPGQSFGELGVMSNSERNATVRCPAEAETDLHCLTLDKLAYDEAISQVQKRRSKEKSLWVRQLFPCLGLPCMTNHERSLMQRTETMMRQVVVKKIFQHKFVVARTGDVLDSLRFIVEGECVLSIDVPMEMKSLDKAAMSGQMTDDKGQPLQALAKKTLRIQVAVLKVGDCIGSQELYGISAVFNHHVYRAEVCSPRLVVAEMAVFNWVEQSPKKIKMEQFGLNVILSEKIRDNLISKLNEESRKGWEAVAPVRIPIVVPMKSCDMADSTIHTVPVRDVFEEYFFNSAQQQRRSEGTRQNRQDDQGKQKPKRYHYFDDVFNQQQAEQKNKPLPKRYIGLVSNSDFLHDILQRNDELSRQQEDMATPRQLLPSSAIALSPRAQVPQYVSLSGGPAAKVPQLPISKMNSMSLEGSTFKRTKSFKMPLPPPMTARESRLSKEKERLAEKKSKDDSFKFVLSPKNQESQSPTNRQPSRPTTSHFHSLRFTRPTSSSVKAFKDNSNSRTTNSNAQAPNKAPFPPAVTGTLQVYSISPRGRMLSKLETKEQLALVKRSFQKIDVSIQANRFRACHYNGNERPSSASANSDKLFLSKPGTPETQQRLQQQILSTSPLPVRPWTAASSPTANAATNAALV